MVHLTFLAVTLWAAISSAAETTSASIATSIGASNVPTDAPIPGNYTGALRPQFHYSPPQNFMNDPNGLFRDADGVYHLYYQYNPTGIVAGNQHWGHATSKDLYNWTNQKIALYPENSDEGIFSGSAVVDVNNTSGFFPDQNNGVVAIYTLNTPQTQTQNIAYSIDGGYTFEKYANNPVIPSTSNQFRDPYVIWFEDHWVMVVAYSTAFEIGIFTSPDLKEWTASSNISHHGLLGLQYECPNLIPIPVANGAGDENMFLLIISINPGAPLGGSTTQYFPGTFNGTHFVPIDSATRLTDFVKDNYAGQFFHGIPADEDPVFLTWVSNWQYAGDVPTGQLEGWRSSMSLPRRTHLENVAGAGWTLVSYPYDMTPLYNDTTSLAANENLGNGNLSANYASLPSGAIYISCTLTTTPNHTIDGGTLNFIFTSSLTGESISGGIFLGGDTSFWLSRHNMHGFGETNPFFTDKFSIANPSNTAGTFTLDVVVDRSILEVFLDGGRSSGSMTFFPEGVLDRVEVSTQGLAAEVKVDAKIWGLQGGMGEYGE
ncbi:glycoside hydrolase family 32 protein [Sclerotinia borealis F-4128]|uniref:Glycoside hydrolase family 32 protein n=1 Tax=Sclerotinia borealis (strain F-4128) TaxID=1432307 RepID=W9CMJ6_SCLBF|nr:glycoside hydrolase family 32 protein [Sclerotinia borealis F-4128]